MFEHGYSMTATNRVVFIHMPKTGGTFVNHRSCDDWLSDIVVILILDIDVFF